MRSLVFPVIILSFTLCAVLSSCKKTINEVKFSKNFADKTFFIDTTVNSGVGLKLLGYETIATGIEESLVSAGFSINNLKSAEVSDISIETVDPNQNLNYFKSVEIRLNSTGAEQAVFASAVLPDITDLKVLQLAPTDLEMGEFFKDGEVTFSFYGLTDLNIVEPLEMRFSLKFKFRAALGN